MKANPRPSGRVLVLTRRFAAPRALVFRAWTEPAHLTRWWGPDAFTLPTCQVDFRVGGKYKFCMRAPDGSDHWVWGRIPRDRRARTVGPLLASHADSRGERSVGGDGAHDHLCHAGRQNPADPASGRVPQGRRMRRSPRRLDPMPRPAGGICCALLIIA